METCKQCGARLNTSEELDRHNKEMHPQMGKKGGEMTDERKERKPLGRPID